ncbi:MAG TPA: hypothetical protein VF786_05835 [Terriglobales bacterium]
MAVERIRRTFAPGVFWLFCASLLLLGGCVPPPSARNHNRRPDPPGLYSLSGWQGVRYDVDINGEVGHQLYVSNPTARCEPSRHWSGDAQIVSGALPSGLSMDYSTMRISGIPTERGHWIVKMKLSNVQCGGSYYEGFTQELRFHITGTGRVIQ